MIFSFEICGDSCQKLLTQLIVKVFWDFPDGSESWSLPNNECRFGSTHLHSTCILHKTDVLRHVVPYITWIHQITYLHDTAGNI